MQLNCNETQRPRGTSDTQDATLEPCDLYTMNSGRDKVERGHSKPQRATGESQISVHSTQMSRCRVECACRGHNEH